jgi:hypothetical protein
VIESPRTSKWAFEVETQGRVEAELRQNSHLLGQSFFLLNEFLADIAGAQNMGKEGNFCLHQCVGFCTCLTTEHCFRGLLYLLFADELCIHSVACEGHFRRYSGDCG